MLVPFIGLLALIVFGSVAVLLIAMFRQLNAGISSSLPVPSASRYRPMLRLLSEEDCAFVSGNRSVAKKLRLNRNRLFRAYLRCLTKDYARLLGGIRLAMVHSNVDRPDLARALAANKFRFAVALCRIEVRLRLHAVGMANVDVSGLVEAMDALRTQVTFLAPVPLQAR